MAKMKDLLIDAITNCPLEMLLDELYNRLQQTDVFKGRTNADQYSIHGAMEELRDAWLCHQGGEVQDQGEGEGEGEGEVVDRSSIKAAHSLT
jgi:hypothetical protein